MDFAGFLFGNVNEDGELEDDEVLDKVKMHLSSTQFCDVMVTPGLCGRSESPWCGTWECAEQ